uniref:Uncharacterized protein n=1 Tax=Quercus lobata TaxID=97700 RepID=A0A7N2LNZ8_QUELO
MESGHENLEDPVTSVIKETIYVAVGLDVKDCKSTLLWALQNNGGKRICIIHLLASLELYGFLVEKKTLFAE